MLDLIQQPRLPPPIGHLPGDVTPAGARQRADVTPCHVIAAITSITVHCHFRDTFIFAPCCWIDRLFCNFDLHF
jgi:hypothetical protein